MRVEGSSGRRDPARLTGLAAFALLAANVLLPRGLPLWWTLDGGALIHASGEAQWYQAAILLLVCAVGARALLLGRPGAIETLAWSVGLVACWVKPVHQHPPPEPVLDLVCAASLVAGIVGLVVVRTAAGRLFTVPRPPPSARRDLAAGLRLTLALFIVAEAWADYVVRTEHPALLAVGKAEEPVQPVLDPLDPALPTFVTLASSGGNAEREANEPFSLLLARRFRGRGNFVYTFEGGINSARLRRIAEEWLAKPQRPAAFVFYEGFQDYNYSTGLELLRVVNEPTGTTGTIFRALVRRSRLLTLLLYRLRRDDCMHRGANCNDRVETIFEGFARNLEAIVDASAKAGTHVFLVTLALDESRVLPDGIRYVAKVNDYLRLLARTRPNTTLVDFRARVDADFAARDVRRCEPYELGLTSEACGNQYHLSRKGHALLADVAAPVVEAWLKR